MSNISKVMIPCVAAICCFIAVSDIARAETCALTGHWTIQHGNGAIADMDIQQDAAGKLIGVGMQRGVNIPGHVPTGTESGAGASRTEGRSVLLIIQWNNETRGHYQGNVGLDNRISGVNFDEQNPTSQTTWFTKETNFMCQ